MSFDASALRPGAQRLERQTWIDLLKGIGITLVVLGHVSYNKLLVQTIFMFHMPLFFLLGGWLHNAGAPQLVYLKAKARSLLVPYLCFLVLLWPIELLMAFPDQAWSGAWMVDTLLKPMLLGGQMLTGVASVFWFVTCYFLTQQLMHFLLRRFSMTSCALICAAMLALAYVNAGTAQLLTLPWSANSVLFAAPLYLIGYLARAQRLRTLLPLYAGVALVGGLLNVFGVRNSMDIKALDYGVPLLTLVCAVACVALLAVLAQLLQTKLLGRALAMLGGASMTIMFLHQFVQLTMAKLFGITQALPRLVVALLACYLMHQLFKTTSLTARLLLGSSARPAPPVSGGVRW